MNEILFPALAIGAIGLVLGALLAVASKIFASVLYLSRYTE